MNQAHDWRLIFACPICGKSGGVAGAVMGSVLRCPHCRKRVCISRDGIRKAPRLVSRWRERPTEKEIVARPRRNWTRGRCATCASLLLVAAGVGAISMLPARTGEPSSTDGVRALAAAAREFQHAWLDDDMKTARTFVIDRDAMLLSSWTLPRRAALVASFGAQFEGSITAVDVISTDATGFTVRTRFRIRGREQQSLQTWTRTPDGWRLLLAAADAQQP